MKSGAGMEGARAPEPHVREQAPHWPRRADEPEDQPSRQRWRREPEPFEEGGLVELFAGAAVLQDAADGADNLRILVRFVVARLLGLAASGRIGAAELRIERRLALDHLRLLPRHDWERRLLEQLVAYCRQNIGHGVMGILLVAAEASAKRGHSYGAFDLYRSGFDLSRARGWWEDAQRCADGIARLAVLEEAHRSATLWRRRARVMYRRAEAAAVDRSLPDSAGEPE